MTRLRTGDRCPCCGEEIKTSDPFTLGYLSAIRDMARREYPQDARPEQLPGLGYGSMTEGRLFGLYLSSGYDDCMDFHEYRRRYEDSGGKVEEDDDETDD